MNKLILIMVILGISTFITDSLEEYVTFRQSQNSDRVLQRHNVTNDKCSQIACCLCLGQRSNLTKLKISKG